MRKTILTLPVLSVIKNITQSMLRVGCGLALLPLATLPVAAQLNPYVWQEQTGLAVKPNAAAIGGVLLAYDTARHACILVHRFTYQGTWLWDGQVWVQASVSGLQPENPAGMVFDTQRGVAVLFCTTDGLVPGKTWEWNGSSWRLASSKGLISRDDFAMAYDSFRGRTVVFGGQYGLQGPEPAWTWEWDGTDWRVVATNGPVRRVLCAAAYDDQRRVTVLFGGRMGIHLDDPIFGDTWTWDGRVWTQVASTGPSARRAHSMAYDSVRERVLLFAGSDGSEMPIGAMGLADTWEWNGAQWSLSVADGLPPRYDAALAYDPDHRQAIVFGGTRRIPPDGEPIDLQDTWLLNLRDIWVDYSFTGTETGDFATPFTTLANAVSSAAPVSFIKIKPGVGVEAISISKPLTLTAPLGAVTIHGH